MTKTKIDLGGISPIDQFDRINHPQETMKAKLKLNIAIPDE